jgi:uncharacterized protein
MSTDAPPSVDLGQVAQATGLLLAQVEKTAHLLDAGNTVPFITRYRKDQTGGLDEEQIRQVRDRISRLRLIEERRQVILRTIESQGKLTDDLAARIRAASSIKALEDLYLPYKPRKQPLAMAARERGLAPLAAEILAADPACANLDLRAADFINTDRQVGTAADALLGAGHILAEITSEAAELRGRLREILSATGRLATEKVGTDEDKARPFRDYFTYSEAVGQVPPHRVLAINRGERMKILKIRFESDSASLEAATDAFVVPEGHPHAEFLKGCGRDALARLILPSLEREIRRELTEAAEEHAVKVFARNLKNLVLIPPVRDRRVLAIDPGFKSGCKLAALDEYGQLLDQAVIHLVGADERKAAGRAALLEMIQKHGISVVAIGNGTGCRDSEQLVADLLSNDLKDQGVCYVIVNEAGASVYSTSPAGREEMPDFDATLRGAVSIGRRLQDPLSELVKIDPANLGVGMYQHDIKEKHLKDSLDQVVESCVSYVGVEVNSASPALLRYVSGLNQLTARRLYDFRREHGPFHNREQFRQVMGIGETTFVQAAGFLKIGDGDCPLDGTWIHPESYDLARKILARLSMDESALSDKDRRGELAQKAASLDKGQLALELGVGEWTVADVIAQLQRPGRDPRSDLPPPIFKKGILKLEDLVPGMELAGTVLNVVDFGAFVDVGLKDSGLVHVSQLGQRFVKSPHEVIAVGDIVKVWVLSVDKERRRVSLTMRQPGAPREERKRPPRADKPRGPRPHGKPPRHDKPPVAVPAGDQSAQPAVGADGQAESAATPPSPRHGGHRPAAPSRPPRPGRPSAPARSARPPKPARPVIPITDAMKKGKEPMRTFGDLLQFYQMQEKPPEPPPPPDVSTEGEPAPG